MSSKKIFFLSTFLCTLTNIVSLASEEPGHPSSAEARNIALLLATEKASSRKLPKKGRAQASALPPKAPRRPHPPLIARPSKNSQPTNISLSQQSKLQNLPTVAEELAVNPTALPFTAHDLQKIELRKIPAPTPQVSAQSLITAEQLITVGETLKPLLTRQKADNCRIVPALAIFHLPAENAPVQPRLSFSADNLEKQRQSLKPTPSREITKENHVESLVTTERLLAARNALQKPDRLRILRQQRQSAIRAEEAQKKQIENRRLEAAENTQKRINALDAEKEQLKQKIQQLEDAKQIERALLATENSALTAEKNGTKARLDKALTQNQAARLEEKIQQGMWLPRFRTSK